MVQKKKARIMKPPGSPFGGSKEESKMDTRITKPQPVKSKMAAGSTVPHPGGPLGGPNWVFKMLATFPVVQLLVVPLVLHSVVRLVVHLQISWWSI